MLPELYHAHHNRHIEDLPFWLGLAARVGDPILELGCGTGRVLIPLAQAGHHCTGLDRDLGMLRYLRTHLEPAMPTAPAIFAGDIGCFNLAEQFSLVILPCNTYSTLNSAQRHACLQRTQKHLKPGGMFAASLPNPELWKHLPGESDSVLEDEFILAQTGNPVQVSSSWQRTRKTFAVTWNYDQLFPDGRVERVTLQAVHHRSSVKTYLDEITAAGFTMDSIFGDYDGSEFSEQSPYLILQATA